MSTSSKSKTRKHKYDLRQLISLTCASTSSLTHAPQLSECVEMRRASLLFIFFCSLYAHSNSSASLNNYLLGPTSLGESNNPSAPQLVGNFPLRPTRRVILNTTVGTISLTYNNSPRVDFSRIVNNPRAPQLRGL